VAYRTRVFIDFWNFSLNWKERADNALIDWTTVPRVLVDEGQKKLEAVGITEGLQFEEAIVYASYLTTDSKLRGWLDSFLDRQPGFNVKARPRKSKPRKVHCPSCGADNEACGNCGEPLTWAPEKGVDTAIVTDLLALAGEDAYDVAILLSSDADHIPAVEWVQARGKKVINATWAKHGFDLKRTCWAEIELDAVMPLMKR